MKKEVPHQKENQKSQRSNVDIEARKPKRESIEDIKYSGILIGLEVF